MSDIREIMGVCPQHDILWKELTGREHIELFAALKKLPLDKVDAEITARLTDVGMTRIGSSLNALQ